MASVDDYKKAVSESKLLNEFEKKAMLDGAESLPQDFIEQMIPVLTDFDERTAEREQAYLKEIGEAFGEFKNEIGSIPGLSDEKRKLYLEKAETLHKAILSKVNPS